jgi:hypothetical protein
MECGICDVLKKHLNEEGFGELHEKCAKCGKDVKKLYRIESIGDLKTYVTLHCPCCHDIDGEEYLIFMNRLYCKLIGM